MHSLLAAGSAFPLLPSSMNLIGPYTEWELGIVID